MIFSTRFECIFSQESLKSLTEELQVLTENSSIDATAAYNSIGESMENTFEAEG